MIVPAAIQMSQKRKTKMARMHEKADKKLKPFDFVLDFGPLHNVIVIGLLEYRFHRVEANEFDFGGSLAGGALRVYGGRAGAVCHRNGGRLKCGRADHRLGRIADNQRGGRLC